MRISPLLSVSAVTVLGLAVLGTPAQADSSDPRHDQRHGRWVQPHPRAAQWLHDQRDGRGVQPHPL